MLLAAAAASGAAQSRPTPAIEGQWQARAREAIHFIMVRSDSSAQFGEQIARWRVVGDSLWLALGDGVWMVYGMRVDGERLTLSGGDLEKPVTLRRTGPAVPRLGQAEIPDPPPPESRAW
jgi:hypothetical protein